MSAVFDGVRRRFGEPTCERLRTDTRPRIVAVGPTPPPFNGMSVVTDHLLRSSVATSYNLTLVDTADRRGLENVGRLDVGNVAAALRSGIRFVRALTKSYPDAVYVPVAQNSLGFVRDCLFMVPALLIRAPLVVHIHGGYFGTFYRRSNVLLRVCIRQTVGRAKAVIVLGESLRSMLDGIVDASRVVVIPNGVDDFMSELKEPNSGEPPSVLFLSTLMADKGVFDVIRAAAKVSRLGRNVKFVFAGEWVTAEQAAAARHLIRELGLENAVQFLGVVAPPAKWRVLESATCFVLPSRYRYEGQPLAILEAMCAGVPVIASTMGAIPETVEDGVCGALVDPGDVVALARAIEEIISSRETRDRMGAAGRLRFVRHYTVERWGEDMVRMFDSLRVVPRDEGLD